MKVELCVETSFSKAQSSAENQLNSLVDDLGDMDLGSYFIQ